MAPLLLVLLPCVTALLLVGAEGPPHGSLRVGAGGPWPGSPRNQRPPDTEDGLQLSDDDIMSGEGLPAGEVRCAICKRVATALKNIVVNPKDKAGVEHVTHRVCGRLPVGRRLCRHLLRHALVPIEAALAHHQSPAHLCAHLHLCHPQP